MLWRWYCRSIAPLEETERSGGGAGDSAAGRHCRRIAPREETERIRCIVGRANTEHGRSIEPTGCSLRIRDHWQDIGLLQPSPALSDRCSSSPRAITLDAAAQPCWRGPQPVDFTLTTLGYLPSAISLDLFGVRLYTALGETAGACTRRPLEGTEKMKSRARYTILSCRSITPSVETERCASYSPRGSGH